MGRYTSDVSEKEPLTLTTDYIKREVIPAALTEEELKRICGRFDPPLNLEEEKISMRNPRSWVRESKTKSFENERKWLRIFNYRPLEDQLRCYITSDLADRVVEKIVFQDE